jgi:hypothetical protein
VGAKFISRLNFNLDLKTLYSKPKNTSDEKIKEVDNTT